MPRQINRVSAILIIAMMIPTSPPNIIAKAVFILFPSFPVIILAFLWGGVNA